jgi:hypothetical protein
VPSISTAINRTGCFATLNCKPERTLPRMNAVAKVCQN